MQSLIFPTLISLSYLLVMGIATPFITVVGLLSGVLPFLLTIILKADMSEVLKHKLKYSLLCLGGLLFVQAGVAFNVFVISVCFIWDLLYLNTYDLPFKSRLAASLSNPTFLLLAFITELFVDFSAPFNLGFG